MPQGGWHLQFIDPQGGWHPQFYTIKWQVGPLPLKSNPHHTTFGPLLEVEMSKKCTPLWREARFHVKMYKTHHSRTTFGSSDVEKVHAVVARSTFPSQSAQSISLSDHFWKLRCRKSARRCGAKHISKSKCAKTHHVRTIFGGSEVVSRGRRKRDCGPCQK